MQKEKVLVSACLIGKNCKYNGKNNYNSLICEFLKDKEVILVCPEVMGGLSIPRFKSEIIQKDGILRVINEHQQDVTEYFNKGAKIALKLALDNHISYAILKEKSPSCGYKKRYNGQFNKTLIEGSGWFSHLLMKHHIKILTEEDFKGGN